MKVLVVQTAHLGDIVLTVPLLRALDASGASVTLLTTPAGDELLRGQHWLAATRVLDKRRPRRGPRREAKPAGEGSREGERSATLVRSLRGARFDVALAAQRSFRTGLLVRASRAPLRIGYAGSPGAWACTRRVPWDAGRHAVERYLALANGLPGVDTHTVNAAIDVDPAARDGAARLLARRGVWAGGELACLAPGSRWGSKRWLPEGFAAVGRALAERGMAVVIVGSPGERELCRAVGRAAGDVAVLAGETTLPELTAVLAGSRLVVGNDSGTGHLAAAVGTPTVTIFGPTVPRFGYVPYGTPHRVVEHGSIDCRPCHPHGPERCPLGHHRCMGEITPEEVLAAIDLLGPEARTGDSARPRV